MVEEKIMREVTLSDGSKVKVGPLKGRDVRDIDAMQRDESVPTLDTVFVTLERAGFGSDVTDELPFPDVMVINRAILAETYGVEEESKN